MKEIIYILQKSKNNKDWGTVTSFRKGGQSPYQNLPFSEDIAIAEAEGYKQTWKKEWPYIRLVIEI